MDTPNFAGLAALTPDRIEGTYVGSPIKCACGCSGTWLDAGDPGNAMALKRMQARARKDPDSISYYRYSNGGENFSYTTKSRLFIVNSKGPNDE
jgi:hypothetical protein